MCDRKSLRDLACTFRMFEVSPKGQKENREPGARGHQSTTTRPSSRYLAVNAIAVPVNRRGTLEQMLD